MNKFVVRNLQYFGISCLLFPILILAGCRTAPHEKLNAVLWTAYSGEYKAVASSTYANGIERVDRLLTEANQTACLEQTNVFSKLPPAVVMDLDETVFLNTPFQASLVMKGKNWDSETWTNWVSTGKPGAVPGAVDFVKHVEAKGVKVIYITNRELSGKANTISALEALGLTRPEIIFRDNIEDKSKRRAALASSYRIVMLVGDDLSDFTPEARSPELRSGIFEKYRKYFLTSWLVIPNPMYGSWESALPVTSSSGKARGSVNQKMDYIKGVQFESK